MPTDPLMPDMTYTLERLPADGIVVVRFDAEVHGQQARQLADKLIAAVREAKEKQGSNATFLILGSGVKLETLSHDQLAGLGFMRIEPC